MAKEAGWDIITNYVSFLEYLWMALASKGILLNIHYYYDDDEQLHSSSVYKHTHTYTHTHTHTAVIVLRYELVPVSCCIMDCLGKLCDSYQN